jgi:predicted AAA+ superfamily ATPase
MNDTGLMISHAFNERGIVSEQLYQKILKDKLEINAGMLMENIVAQMLVANDCKLFFYSNSSRENKDDRMEIDFLIAKSTITSRHNISPIEVKSGTGYTLTSIQKCIKKFGQYLSTPYVLHTKDVEQKDGLVYLPLYMTPLL